MANTDTHVTRLTRTLNAVTSIFRCHGLQHVPSDADSFGAHDLLYWILFVGVLSGWFLFIFAPQHERLSMLEGRLQVLNSHLRLEKREAKRLESSIDALTHGDPHAWERAARVQLGWVEPGEIIDVASWTPARFLKPVIDAHKLAPQIPALPPAVLPRPAIPPIPPPAPAMRRMFSRVAETTNTEILGPMQGSPPAPARAVYETRTRSSQPAQPAQPVRARVATR